MKPTSKKRLILNISGRVQGVFFRVYAEKKAKELGLTGFVKNEEDGSVSIVAEGLEEKLNELLDWAKKGPQMAKVEKINLKQDSATGEFENFKIVY